MAKLRKIQISSRQGLSLYLMTIGFTALYLTYTKNNRTENMSKPMVVSNVPYYVAVFNYTSEEINKILDGKLNFGLIRNLKSKGGVPHSSPDLGNFSKNELKVKKRLQQRRQHIQETCEKMKDDICGFNPILYTFGRMFYEHNTTICLISKAGSSTWRAHLRRVNKGPPFNVPMDHDEIWRAFLSQPKDVVVKNILASNRIITVRHPLTRLTSAYRSKYNGGKPFSPHNAQLDIEKRKRIDGNNWDDSFYQFWLPALFFNGKIDPDTHHTLGMEHPIDPAVRYSVKEYEKLFDLLKPKLSFVEFLNFVNYQLEIGRPDNHWRPYHSCCCPCYFDYDYITKIETLSEDLHYVFKDLGIPADPDTAMNKLKTRFKDGASMFKDFGYYRDVPLSMKRQLYKWIKKDLELFQYELPKDFWS